MISQTAYPIEPWCVRETELDLDLLAASESVFALSNGHIGLRGNLDEGEPHGLPGTYLNSFFEDRPLPYAESGYGYPESGQTIVNVTNGKLIRLLVDDEPFDMRYGRVTSHERVLDLRAGVLTRHVEWESPAHGCIKLQTKRLVSLTHRSIAAIEYVVTAVNPVRLVVQSELVANEALPLQSDDPRVAAVLEHPLVGLEHQAWDDAAVLVHRTRRSELTMAAAMKHELDGPGLVSADTESFDDVARTTVTASLQAGESLRVVKYLAYGWSGLRSQQSLRDQVLAAIASAERTGWEGLVQEQAEFLRDFWSAADVIVEGDESLQQAVRFGLFHVLQAGARAEERGIPAKGLTGPGYDGHTFWDTEALVLPLLIFTRPDSAADALAWRASTLEIAKQRAQQLGYSGAMFPWRTIRGQECSGYWPAATAAVHVNGDISRAFGLYRTVTGRDDCEHRGGVAVLVETARLWHSLGHHGPDGDWHLPGVTGPDEYSAVVDDNTFTNLLAAHNLKLAADAVRRYPELARDLRVTEEEVAAWQHAAEHVHQPYDRELRVPAQDAGFTRLPEWDFEAYRGKYPLLLHAPYFALYRSQVVKQADLELAMFWFPDRFAPDDVERAVDYYERRTVRDSSLSACIQAVVAAQVGHMDLAYDYAREAALIDLRDLHHNSADGLHMASLAGAWIALVAGFGGMRVRGDQLCFSPQLPDGLHALTFCVRWRGARLRVRVTHDGVLFERLDGPEDVRVRHGEEVLTLCEREPVHRRLRRRLPQGPRPQQPPGREPLGARPAR